jgi:DNA polymerase-3 subunit beta
LDDFKQACRQVVFAAAKESSRYAINGILFELKGKKLALVATDGRRLARRRLSVTVSGDSPFSQQRVIVPPKALALVERMDDGDVVNIGLDGSRIVISSGEIVITSNLVEGTFPKYEDIIPTDYPRRFQISTSALAIAVRRAALLTTEQAKGIKMSLANDMMVLSSRAPEAGDAEVRLPVPGVGEPLDIGFNPQYLLEPLRLVASETVQMELGEPDRPAIIKAEPDFLYVVMPINLG